MAYTYQGDAILGVALSVETPKPLDTRTVVNTTKDLYDIPASQAYRGMTISNLEDGNIYMLIDKNKITTSDGWKSSESALQIITCTQAEYDEWAKNTDENYNPIDSSKNYLLQSVYYYIYEDQELGQYYLSSEWGKDIESQLSKKAPLDEVNKLIASTKEDAENLAENYFTKNQIIETYATIELVNTLLNLESEDSFISKTLSDYYKSTEIDDKFVTKDSLGGNLEDLGIEGEYVFVPTVTYKQDQEAIQKELDKTLKLDGEGSLESITVGQLKSPTVEGETQLVVDIKSEGLFIGDDPIATESDIPVIIPISRQDYDKEVENSTIDPEAYYYIYDETNEKFAYITLQYLEESYSTTSQMQNWVSSNYHNRDQVNKLLEDLNTTRDTNLATKLENYYTIEETNSKFLTQVNASTTYTTQDTFNTFVDKVGTDYVKWSDIGNPEIEGEDFAFVTQDQYAKDKEAQALNFESEEISSIKSTTSELIIQEIEEKEVEQEGETEGETVTVIEKTVLSEVTLTAKDGILISGGKQIALTEEVPQLECKTIEEYNAIEKPDPEVYYFIYDTKEENAWVTQATLEASYYTKSQTSQQIINANIELENKLTEKISKLEAEIQLLKNLLYSSIQDKTLTLGIADNIKDNVLIANTGKIENQTLIFT